MNQIVSIKLINSNHTAQKKIQHTFTIQKNRIIIWNWQHLTRCQNQHYTTFCCCANILFSYTYSIHHFNILFIAQNKKNLVNKTKQKTQQSRITIIVKQNKQNITQDTTHKKNQHDMFKQNSCESLEKMDKC